MNWTALLVFVALFLLVTVIGFVAVRWRRADLDLLHEWGLAGRRLGTIVAWFLLGGDIYTAYTFIAVPALILKLFPSRFAGFAFATIELIKHPEGSGEQTS